MNFVFYNEKYDSFDAIPEWAKKTLKAHQKRQTSLCLSPRRIGISPNP